MQTAAIASPSASHAGSAMFLPSQLTAARDTASIATRTRAVLRIRRMAFRITSFDGAPCESSSAAPLYLAYGRHDFRSQSRQKSGQLRPAHAAFLPRARRLRLSTAHLRDPRRRTLHLERNVRALPAA